MRIYLYKVISEPADFSVADRLASISELAVELRNRARNVDHVRLEHFEIVRGLYFCDFLKIRMHHGPAKAGLDTPVEGFDLERDEGFGEETGMIYDPTTKYAAVQYNHHGPWPTAIAEYLGHFVHNAPVAIEMAPSLDGSIQAKIRATRVVKKLTLAIAPKELTDEDYAQQMSLGEGLKEIADRSDAERIEINISVSRKKEKSLRVDVRRLYRWIRQVAGPDNESPVKSARVTVTDDERNPSQVLDLLEHKVTHEVELRPGLDKRYSRVDRWNALEVAFRGWRNLMQ